MANSYEEGAVVELTGTYTDPTVLHDPTAVFLDVDRPDGTSQTYEFGTDPEVTKDSTGIYNAEIATAGLPGRWFYRWHATGTGASADQQTFQVNAKRT